MDETSSLLTSQIVRQPTAPSIFHSEFDNFDQLVNTLTGAGSVHTAHGIMMQDILINDNEEHGGSIPEMVTLPRDKEKSVYHPVQEELPECFIGSRKSPSYPVVHCNFPGSEGSIELSKLKNVLWIFLRHDSSRQGQAVPGWSGFVSVTGQPPTKLTSIEYYPVINNPITEYKTVQECLLYAEKASMDVGQKYTVTTFDLGVCMKAYPIIWNHPQKYKNHIILIGTFHLICAYLKMVGKKMAGSGLSDILLEAGLIGNGSLQGVLTGKHYERAMHCHKVVLESLERILLQQFLNREGLENVPDGLPETSKQMLEMIVDNPSDNQLQASLNDLHISALVQRYSAFKERVKEGELGKTAMFWIAYMEHIWLVLTLIRAVKTNDFLLYADCLHRMADIFFSFDGQNYARYLTFFSVFIANINESHPGASDLLKRGAISVARSFIPANRCAVDKTMEETFMKHAKSRSGTGGSGSGVTGIARNYDAYQRWVRTTHERSKYVAATLNMADMLCDSESGSRHRDLRPVEIQRSDQEVSATIDAICGFMDPFSLEENNALYCLSSGTRVPTENEDDILRAEAKGKVAKEAFIANRLKKKDKFFEPIKRQNLKTMEVINKKAKVPTAKNKVVEYRQQGNIALQLLVQSQKMENPIELAVLMQYPLTTVPFSIGTADGCLSKTDKSKGLKYLIEGADVANPPVPNADVLVIEDGNALFHSMKEIPGSFKLISQKLFNMMPKKVDVIFSTDMYKADSVKSMERTRRGHGDKLLIQGENTKKPADWKSFLANSENKTQLVQVMSKAWNNDAYAKQLQGRRVVLVSECNAYIYTSDNGNTTVKTRLEELESNQEETDTRVVLYSLYAKEQGYQTVQVRSPDSDIFFILLHYISELDGITVLFDTGSGIRRKLLNVSEMSQSYTIEYRAALLGLHAFCGCDSTSAFKGKGHGMLMKTLEKKPKFTAA